MQARGWEWERVSTRAAKARPRVGDGLQCNALRLAVVDFGFCEGLGPLPRAALHGWLRLFHVTPRAQLEDEMRRLASAAGRPLRFERPFGGYAMLGVIG